VHFGSLAASQGSAFKVRFLASWQRHAALAALALEHGATLCSTDRDFRRFRGLKLVDPLEEARPP
jgi:hypothetical protein